jgi:hypothetical protein
MNSNTFDHAAELSADRQEEDRGDIEAILDGENMNPLEPPAEDWIGPQERIGAVDRADDRALIEDVVDQPFPTPPVLDTKLLGSETEAQRRPKRGMRAVLVVPIRVRRLATSLRKYAGSFVNRLSKQ